MSTLEGLWLVGLGLGFRPWEYWTLRIVDLRGPQSAWWRQE